MRRHQLLIQTKCSSYGKEASVIIIKDESFWRCSRQYTIQEDDGTTRTKHANLKEEITKVPGLKIPKCIWKLLFYASYILISNK